MDVRKCQANMQLVTCCAALGGRCASRNAANAGFPCKYFIARVESASAQPAQAQADICFLTGNIFMTTAPASPSWLPPLQPLHFSSLK